MATQIVEIRGEARNLPVELYRTSRHRPLTSCPLQIAQSILASFYSSTDLKAHKNIYYIFNPNLLLDLIFKMSKSIQY